MEKEYLNLNFEEMNAEENDAPFRVDDDGKADWLIQKLRAKQENTERFIAHYQLQIERAETELKNFSDWAEYKLREYLESGRIPLKETKTEKKYSLPSGELKLKQQPLKYVKDDTELLLEAKNKGLGAYIVQKESVHWAELKKAIIPLENGDVALKETGELLESVKAERQDDKFSISIKERA